MQANKKKHTYPDTAKRPRVAPPLHRSTELCPHLSSRPVSRKARTTFEAENRVGITHSSCLYSSSPVRMFSGFDFKRFSLDALQDADEEHNEETPATPLPVVPEQAERSERMATPPPQKLPPIDKENSEWDWDQDTPAPVETDGGAKVGGAPERREETHSQRGDKSEGDSSGAIPTAGMAVVVGSPAKPEQNDGQSNSDGSESGDTGQEGAAAEERRDVFQEANNAPAVSAVEEVLSNEKVRAVPTGVLFLVEWMMTNASIELKS